MKLKYIKNQSDSESSEYDDNYMVFEKPCKCTICCFNRLIDLNLI